MGIRLRHLQFDPVAGSQLEGASMLDAVVSLSDQSPVHDFGVQLPSVPDGPLTVTAQRIQALCEAHGIPCRVRTSSSSSEGIDTLELRMGPSVELAERFGAAVRERLEQERLRIGIVVTLGPTARTVVLDRMERRFLTPLPDGVPAAWGCAVQLLDGMSVDRKSKGPLTQWAP